MVKSSVTKAYSPFIIPSSLAVSRSLATSLLKERRKITKRKENNTKYVKWTQMHDYVQKRKPPGSQELFSSSSPPPPSGARERPFLLHHLVVRREWRETLGTKLFQSHVSERGNFVSKTELKTYIGHRKECKCVTFKCLDFTFFTVANLRFQLSY